MLANTLKVRDNMRTQTRVEIAYAADINKSIKICVVNS